MIVYWLLLLPTALVAYIFGSMDTMVLASNFVFRQNLRRLGQGNRWVHMPRRAAAGEDDALQFSAHGAFRLSKCRYPDFPGFICRETDSTTPISTSWMQRAVPP